VAGFGISAKAVQEIKEDDKANNSRLKKGKMRTMLKKLDIADRARELSRRVFAAGP
jgi:hypothetical protein